MPAQDSQGRYVTPSESPWTVGGTDTPSFTFSIAATTDRDA